MDQESNRCDLLENSYLCGSNNNQSKFDFEVASVVICLKIPTFVVATTTRTPLTAAEELL